MLKITVTRNSYADVFLYRPKSCSCLLITLIIEAIKFARMKTKDRNDHGTLTLMKRWYLFSQLTNAIYVYISIKRIEKNAFN